MKAVVGAFIGLLGLALIPPALADASPPPDYAAIIAAPDRTDADRKNDERRQAVKLLAFTGVLPGWKVITSMRERNFDRALIRTTLGRSQARSRISLEWSPIPIFDSPMDISEDGMVRKSCPLRDTVQMGSSARRIFKSPVCTGEL